MSTVREGRVVNICRYRVKPGKEAEMEVLLAKHWPALRAAGLATDDEPMVFRGRGGGEMDGSEAGARTYVEIFSWVDDRAPEIAHETPSVMAIWEPMGAICEEMEFPAYVAFSPPYSQ